MAATPSGSPPWARSALITQYGGHINKENYLSIGAINPQTDVTAEHIMRLAADLAAIANTADFAVLNITQDDTTPDDPTVNSARLMTAVTSTAYEGDAPPTGFPTVTRVSDGVIQIAFASSYTDDYGVSANFEAIDVEASVCDDDSCYCTWLPVGNDYTIRVYTWDENGAAATDKTISVRVS